jgi:hypothetical protein
MVLRGGNGHRHEMPGRKGHGVQSMSWIAPALPLNILGAIPESVIAAMVSLL